MKQISVFVENQPGSLMRVTTALTEAKINIRAVSSFDAPDFGILRLVVDQPMEAKDYLTSRGFVVRVQDVIGAELKDEKGALMPIMQRAQDIYGYLPYEVQKIISDETGIPLEKIYGVATFYSQFNLNPKGRYRISVCLGTACYVKGSGDIYNKLMEKLGIVGGECTPDGKFSLDACRCVGACGLAPVMMINDEVYGRLTVDDIDDILAKYE